MLHHFRMDMRSCLASIALSSWHMLPASPPCPVLTLAFIPPSQAHLLQVTWQNRKQIASSPVIKSNQVAARWDKQPSACTGNSRPTQTGTSLPSPQQDSSAAPLQKREGGCSPSTSTNTHLTNQSRESELKRKQNNNNKSTKKAVSFNSHQFLVFYHIS